MKRASTFKRALALIVDLLVLVLAGMFLKSLSHLGYMLGAGETHGVQPDLLFGFLYVLVGLFYFTSLTMGGAQTIGKMVVGLRVTTLNGEGAGLCRSLWRSCCYVLSALPFFFGFLLSFVVKGRSLHDCLAGTVVIKEEQ